MITKISVKLIILILFFSSGVFTQTQEWARTYNGNNVDESIEIVTDASGNCYIAGRTVGSGNNSNMCLLKYNASGVLQWDAIYNGPQNNFDEPTDLFIDNNGNLYLTGITYVAAGNYDLVTLKYNSNGAQQWAQVWGNSLREESGGIYTDNSGNVYICGYTEVTNGQNYNYVTIKYNSSGVLQWAKQYNNPINSSDYAYFITGDGTNVYVTGTSVAQGSGTDLFTIKYNSNGDSLWTARYSGTNSINEIPAGIAADNSGNVYVTCRTQGTNSGTDYMTLKYNANGVEQWQSRYTSPGNSQDIPEGLAIDNAGNVYVTGRTRINSSYNDFGTVKYNSNGVQQWFTAYNNTGIDRDDYGYDIKVDNAGNVYVTGNSQTSGTDRDAVTIKYNSAGEEQWVARYDVTNDEETFSLALDASNNIYVCGFQVTTTSDILTIKYSQTNGISTISSEIPVGYSLTQNYPNPFNPVTNINFSIPTNTFVKLALYDIAGKEVAVLINEDMNAGTYKYDFDGTNLASGVYFYRLETEKFTEVKKMILNK